MTLSGPLPPLAIPSTLHDSLMARLDRLATVREVAQMGATLGREFSYELLQAVSLVDEATLQQATAPSWWKRKCCISAGCRRRPRYIFKHALIQDTAYQSLLKSKRQQFINRLPRCWKSNFPRHQRNATRTAGPSLHRGGADGASHSLLATGRTKSQSSARPMWKRLVTSPRGWSCSRPCRTLPNAPSKNSRYKSPWAMPLMATKGYAAPEVEKAYTRARELCQQVGETPQLFPVLWGLWVFYLVRAELQTARELGEQLLTLGPDVARPGSPLGRPIMRWGRPCSMLGELTPAREHSGAGDCPLRSSAAPLPCLPLWV